MVNKVILIGNLGQDPEVRYNQAGVAFCNLSLATSETWKDKQTGEKKEHTEWHRIVFSGRSAEVAGEYLHKGSKIYVEGKLQTRKWQDNQGNDKYTTEIRGFTMQMLDSRGDGQQQQTQQRPRQQQQQGYSGPPGPQQQQAPSDQFNDDIPF